ncbi:hypothetical protein MTO96_041403, partial [Rhipicephalus appendiculatus]
MYRHLRKLSRWRPRDYDESGIGDEEDDTSASPDRLLSEARDEIDSSSSLTDSYRFALIGVGGPTDYVGISEPDPAVMRRGIAQFTVELLQNLVESRSEPSSNVVFSPLAVETTLALLYSHGNWADGRADRQRHAHTMCTNRLAEARVAPRLLASHGVPAVLHAQQSHTAA